MGTMAKRLGQMASKSLESESANILKTAGANKVPGSLALALDGTLRRGHDMKVFGLGTAATMSNRARYGRFTRSMHAVYSTMEQELDAVAPTNAAVGLLWDRHGGMLRRAPSLAADLEDVGVKPELDGDISSAATAAYVAQIRAAGAADLGDSGSARLLGHVYCRYFADLFGGSMLAFPTAAALDLPAGTPQHYNFDFDAYNTDRRAAIESIYWSFNEAGDMLPVGGVDTVSDEAMRAFAANVGVYSEEPVYRDAMQGALNLVAGVVTGRGR